MCSEYCPCSVLGRLFVWAFAVHINTHVTLFSNCTPPSHFTCDEELNLFGRVVTRYVSAATGKVQKIGQDSSPMVAKIATIERSSTRSPKLASWITVAQFGMSMLIYLAHLYVLRLSYSPLFTDLPLSLSPTFLPSCIQKWRTILTIHGCLLIEPVARSLFIFQVHSCDLCSKTFSRNGDLKRHKSIHSGEK